MEIEPTEKAPKQSRLFLLLSLVSVLPTAAWAGFLGSPPETSPLASPLVELDLPSPPPQGGLPNLAGRTHPRAADYVLGSCLRPGTSTRATADSNSRPSVDSTGTVPEPSPALMLLGARGDRAAPPAIA